MELNGIDRCLECLKDKDGSVVCPHCGWDERRSDRSPPYLGCGTWLNERYVIGAVLGHGGFGVTYLAWDIRLNTRVAVKEYLPRDFGTRASDGLSVSCFNDEALEWFSYGRNKFLEEARRLARFREHPGIVDVLDHFEANGTAYMVMHYVEGMDLKAHLECVGGKIPWEVALGILSHVLDALRTVHEAGLLHRDMSPDNIYVTSDGRIKILDFGAAKDATGSHSQSQALIRKPGYSPEEQYRTNGQQGPWTDVYGAAATMYRILAGVRPPEALNRLAEDSLQPPSELGVVIEPEHEAVLMKALSVRGPDRYQTIQDFQTALSGGGGVKKKTDQDTSNSWRRWILGLLILGLLVSGGWVWDQHIKEMREKKRVGAEVTTPAAQKRAEAEATAKAAKQRAEAKAAQQRAEAKAAQQRAEAKAAQQRAEAKVAQQRAEAKAAQQRAEAKAAQQQRQPEASQCQSGYLNAARIRKLVTNRTAIGVKIKTQKRWKEYQGAGGTAYFQLDGGTKKRGKWIVENGNICWCYGECREYACKRVWAAGNCTTWYYVELKAGKKTGRVDLWIPGDLTD